MVIALIWCVVLYEVLECIFRSKREGVKKVARLVLPTCTLVYIIILCTCIDSVLDNGLIIPVIMFLITLALCCKVFLSDNNDKDSNSYV